MIDCQYVSAAVRDFYADCERKKQALEDYEESVFMQSEDYSNAKYAYKKCVFDLEKARFLGDEKKVAELTEQKKVLLENFNRVRASMKRVDLKYAPHCPICFDTGYHDGKRCSCYVKNVSRVAYEFMQVPPPKLVDFTDNLLKDERSAKLFAQMQNYCSKFSDHSKNLLLLGERGTGKTFIAKAICKRLEDLGKNAIFLNAFSFNDLFIRFFSATETEKLWLSEILSTCDLLVIDDLGAAPIINNVTVERLLMIISQRAELKKPYIITTNLALDEIGEKFGERAFSRINSKDTVKIPFSGKDMRVYGV